MMDNQKELLKDLEGLDFECASYRLLTLRNTINN